MSQPIRGHVLLALLIAPVLSCFASRAAAAVDETPPVKVNRTVPRVIPPSLVPRFSAAPSDAEISGARVFEERLVPVGRTSMAENRLLADQLLGYVRSGGKTGLAPFEKFLTTYPSSAWRASLLLNSGIVYRKTGYISRALDAWRESWELSKGAVDPLPRAVADRALGEYAALLARLGRTETLAQLLTVTNARNVGGSAAEKMEHARDGLALMRAKPEVAFRCGPLALDRVLASLRESYVAPKALEEFPSTLDGTSLAQVAQLAREVGQPMRMAKRTPGAPFKVPAVVHWKSGHFAALVREYEGAYLIEDATFDDQIWISRDALESETSGYALIEEGPLPANWRVVGRDEASRIWGKGATTENNPQNYKPCDEKSGCEAGTCSPNGMAVARVHLMLVSLNIVDEPVGYSPSLGPAVRFTATYNQREVYQPQTFTYSNLGPKWTFDWLSYIEDNTQLPNQNVQLYVRGGGQETYAGYNTQTHTYDPHKESRAFLIRTLDPDGYQRHLPDGSIETFSLPHGTDPTRKVFLTSVADARGNTMAFTYGQSPSGGLRLMAIQDAEGQVTILAYDDPDDLKVTGVTDPFGRSASFEYLSGRLSSITDVLNLTSAFQYGSLDFIEELTTPYGTSVFEMGETTPQQGGPRSRWLMLTDPLGASERVEYHSDPGNPHGLPAEDPDGAPSGHFPGVLNWRNTFYWSKRAISDPLDYSKARIYHWLHTAPGGKNSGILESFKDPLESRIWYLYPGQGSGSIYEGTFAQPSEIARLLDGDGDGDTGQVRKFTYNLKGKVCTSTDPMNRKTRYTYGTGTTPDAACEAGSGIDLLKVEQLNNIQWEQTFEAQYDTDHQPIMTKDAAGQITSYTYLPDGTGRLLSVVTPARNGHDGNPLTLAERTTTYEYYADTHPDYPWRLKKIIGPSVGAATGPTVEFTYDSGGRVRTTTDSDNYTLTFDYDAMNRLTKTTYPDATYEETTYNKLDPEGHRDRLGRWSYTFHDELRRIKQTKDALLRETDFSWCPCGSLDSITDAEEHTTSWPNRDIQGRTRFEQRADGKLWEYVYEDRTSRLKQIIDPQGQGQVKEFAYALDDKLTSVTYDYEVNSTPDVTYDYGTPTDPYGRLQSVLDGTGTTSYGYHPIGAPGALKIASIDGPLLGTTDRIDYGYDAIGLVTNRKLDGAINEVNYKFDSLGRLRSQLTPIGTFTFGYVGVTGRRLDLLYPNGQRVEYAYHLGVGDHRLKEIHNKLPSGSTLSKFTYTYDPVATINTWSQQRGPAPAQTYDFTYDAADQLRFATPIGPSLPSYEFTYDDVGSRKKHILDAAVREATYDDRNRILDYGPAGGNPTIFTHDDSGNMTAKGSQTYAWDAEYRLVIAGAASGPILFQYDGQGRRSSKTAAGVNRKYIYDGARLLAEKLDSGSSFRYFDGPGIDEHLAMQDSTGAITYFASDHLGSVTDHTSSAGTITLTRKYDPWGNLLSGGTTSGPAFTGRDWDAETGLYYYRARYYDPKIGRFLSEDPIRFDGGINFYAYVRNNPINSLDPSGTIDWKQIVRNATLALFQMLNQEPPPPPPPDPVPIVIPEPPPSPSPTPPPPPPTRSDRGYSCNKEWWEVCWGSVCIPVECNGAICVPEKATAPPPVWAPPPPWWVWAR